jgi:hypothetical protein
MRRLSWLLVLLVLAVVFLPTAAPAHHKSSPGLTAYVEGFCYKPRPGRVLLSAVAIARRFTVWRDTSFPDTALAFSLWGDAGGGPEEFRLLDSQYRAWDRDARDGQDPQWVSWASSFESGFRKSANFDALRVDALVGFGDSYDFPYHRYEGVAQWTPADGCSTRHAGTVEQP